MTPLSLPRRALIAGAGAAASAAAGFRPAQAQKREITELEMANKGPGFFVPPARKSGREEGWIGGKTKLLESAVQAVSADLSHRSLVEAVDAAKRNMLAFATVLVELEQATVEASSWMADFVPSEEVVRRLRLVVEDVMLGETGQCVNQHVLR